MAMADRTHEQVCSAVLAAFGLPAPDTVRLIPEGLMNRNWEVATPAGRFAVKEVVDVGPDVARRQHAAARALAAAGLPVPAPQVTADGDTLAAVGGHLYALTPWAPGQMVPARSWSPQQAAAVGVLLAELHIALAAALPPAPQTVAVTVTSPATARARIGDYRRQAAAGGTAFDAETRRALAERDVLLARWAEHRPHGGERGPAGWTHGDFHDLNLLWEGPSVSAVLDWDRVGVRPYADEVVRTATLPLVFGVGDKHGLDLGLVAAFAGGYRKACGLPAVALAEAAERQRWERICDVWQLKVHYDKGDPSCDHLFWGASALIGWWCRHRKLVTDALTAD
ncbi:phosphotransferase [Streptomyces paromomycinus]|uniref:Stress response kinase A n=1 Tax=Streptomyces paromomycinus TaxID=92743 RepID=A0A401VXI9_STREY|nr:phosphotransferase [Streptomyces paromomycinus]GCD41751.1 stress response kinase A [Streptomyces paromomycinus]